MDTDINNDALRSILEELAHLLINPSRLTILDDPEVVFGGYGEVYLATLDDASKVAVKQLRIAQTKKIRLRVAMRLAREVKIWAKASHPNVLKLIGFHLSEQYDYAQLISPYMENGNIAQYMERNQAGMEVRLGFVRGITLGLAYLHACDPPICHGDLKPVNVLINDRPDAVLCDFGLATFIKDSEAASGLTTTRSIKGSVRYMSPELLDDKETKHTLESDIWAWACTTFEIITNIRPYADFPSDRSVWVALAQGLCPGSMELLGGFAASEDDVPYRSTLVTLQDLLPECWSMEPKERPHSSSLLNRLDYVDLGNSDLPQAQKGTEERTGTPSRDDDLSCFITDISEHPVSISGGFGDVYSGIHKKKGKVALKRLRVGDTAKEKDVLHRFVGETNTWRRLRHTYLLEFLGTYIWGNHICLVSPFIENGTVLRYIKTYPNVNRVRLVCETSEAIAYLHEEGFIHGNIRGRNILVDDDGHALLCDFGLTTLPSAQTSIPLGGAGNIRWQSPELWQEDSFRTFASDVYAFAMTIAEVLTGKAPFFHLSVDGAVILAVLIEGKRPQKIPMDFNGISYETAWKVAEACWPQAPEKRIPMSEAFRLLKQDPSLT